MAGDYDRAEEQDRIAQLLQTTIQNAEQKRNENLSINRLYERWQQLQKDQQEITEKWDQRLHEIMNECDEQQTQLHIQQTEEIERFIGKWKDPGFLRPFTKPTQKLLQLREQERAMGLARMYAQAKEMKVVADRLQREETQAAQTRINGQMTAERQKIGRRHDRELKILILKRDQEMKSIRERKQKELRPVLTAIQQIKAKKGKPFRHPSSLPALPARAENVSAAGQENLCSPRTAARYSVYRAEKKTVMLEVVPVDEQMIAQLRKPTTGRAKSVITGRGRG
jgi:hypothetical protein